MRGVAGRYSPGAALTQIVPYSSSLYTVFHSVIYNSVVCAVLVTFGFSKNIIRRLCAVLVSAESNSMQS